MIFPGKNSLQLIESSCLWLDHSDFEAFNCPRSPSQFTAALKMSTLCSLTGQLLFIYFFSVLMLRQLQMHLYNTTTSIQFWEFMGGSNLAPLINLRQYQERSFSAVPVSLFCGNKGQSRKFPGKISIYHKCSTLEFVRFFAAAAATVYIASTYHCKNKIVVLANCLVTTIV